MMDAKIIIAVILVILIVSSAIWLNVRKKK